MAGVDPPIDGPPIALSPETYARHSEAVEYVQSLIRTRAPLPGNGRYPGVAPGAWGLLAASATITGGSGTTLGTGTVTISDRSATTGGDSVTVYNAGPSITAGSGGNLVRLAWTGGDWAVSCPGGS